MFFSSPLATIKKRLFFVREMHMQKLPLQSLDSILEQVLILSHSLPTITVSLQNSLHFVLAEPIQSNIDIPAFTNSAMDGYAIASSQLETIENEATFQIIGRSLAGHPYEGRAPQNNRVIQIMTGAALPSFFDTVIPFRLVQKSENSITISQNVVRHFANVRKKGEEIQKGCTVLNAGERISAYHIGLLASLGIEKVTVYNKPSIAIFSTGDELQELGQPLQKGQIYNVNGYALTAYFQDKGYNVQNLGILADHPERIQKALETTLADIFITSGGVGQGTRDFLSQQIAQQYNFQHVHIAMRPGKPLVFGSFNNSTRTKYFFGLPGNPIAAMLSAQTFIRPLLAKLRQETPKSKSFSAQLTGPLVHKPGRTELVRGTVFRKDHQQFFTPYPHQGSAMFTSMTNSNAIALLPSALGNLNTGDWVSVRLL